MDDKVSSASQQSVDNKIPSKYGKLSIRELFKMFAWKFTIVFSHKMDSLFPAYVPCPNIHAGFIRRAPDTKLNKCGIKMEIIDFIVNADKFCKCARRAFRRWPKSAIFSGVIIIRLWMPTQVVA